MSAFYDEMADVALELIAEFGQVGTLKEVKQGEYDPVTGEGAGSTEVAQAGNLILLEYNSNEAGVINASGSLVQEGDKKILLAAKGLEWKPAITTTLEADGQVWTIVNVKEINPAGTPLVYELHGRR
jgi:hypothetical protein